MPIMPHIVELSAAQLGVNGAALSATTTGSWVECGGASQLRLDWEVVNATAAALPLVWYFDIQQFGDASTVVRHEMISVEEAPGITEAGSIVSDLYRRKYRWTSPAGAATYRKFLERPVSFSAFRIAGVTAAGAGATDLVSFQATLRYGV